MFARRSTLEAIAGWLAFLVPLGVYTACLTSSVSFWDTGEMETVPYILGIAHQTGFPVFVLMGWLFSHLLPFGTVAWRLSFMSAIAMAIAARMVFTALRELAIPAPVALAASWLFAFGDIVWERGTRTEVQAFATMFAAIGFACAIRWCRKADQRALYGLFLSIGLGLATHPIELMLLPGFAVVILSRFEELTARRLLTGLALAVAPLVTYVYIPLRAAYLLNHHVDPTLSLGLPPGRPFWDYNDPSSLSKFWDYINGDKSDVNAGLAGMLSISHWGDVWSQYGSTLLAQYGPVAIAAALVGLVSSLRRWPMMTASLALTALLPVLFVLNFDEADVERYFLASLWLFAVFAGVGAYSVFVGLFVRNRAAGLGAATLTLLGVVVWLATMNQGLFGQRDDHDADAFLKQMRALTPPNAVIVANWLTAPAMGYAAYVEHSFGDRIVVAGWPTDYQSFYPNWLRRRPVFIRAENPFQLSVPGLQASLVDAAAELYAVTPVSRKGAQAREAPVHAALVVPRS
ncbi:MAG TPA: DUF2723 domain-containing protein [Candidatus Acidoferrales bacterium]|nr:DUF2723 domain-containing protein [Candidatus Acidoferrales bacterium]